MKLTSKDTEAEKVNLKKQALMPSDLAAAMRDITNDVDKTIELHLFNNKYAYLFRTPNEAMGPWVQEVAGSARATVRVVNNGKLILTIPQILPDTVKTVDDREGVSDSVLRAQRQMQIAPPLGAKQLAFSISDRIAAVPLTDIERRMWASVIEFVGGDIEDFPRLRSMSKENKVITESIIDEDEMVYPNEFG